MYGGIIRQSTTRQVLVGPFIDDTDFKTVKTAVSIANTDVKLSKNGASSVNKTSGGGTHRVNGMYALVWDTADVDTVGELVYSIVVSGSLPVFGSYTVVEEGVYDAFFAAASTGYVSSFKKNTAYSNFTFPMAATGLVVSLSRSIDGGALATATNAVSEVSTSAKVYKVNLSAADLNGDSITFKATASGQPDAYFTIRTNP